MVSGAFICAVIAPAVSFGIEIDPQNPKAEAVAGAVRARVGNRVKRSASAADYETAHS